jgi:hypothetical protein
MKDYIGTLRAAVAPDRLCPEKPAPSGSAASRRFGTLCRRARLSPDAAHVAANFAKFIGYQWRIVGSS